MTLNLSREIIDGLSDDLTIPEIRFDENDTGSIVFKWNADGCVLDLSIGGGFGDEWIYYKPKKK